MPLAKMHEREVKGPEMPVGHDLDKFARTDEFGFHDGWKFANPADVASRSAGTSSSKNFTSGFPVVPKPLLSQA
jgi:hypothetical protein